MVYGRVRTSADARAGYLHGETHHIPPPSRLRRTTRRPASSRGTCSSPSATTRSSTSCSAASPSPRAVCSRTSTPCFSRRSPRAARMRSKRARLRAWIPMRPLSRLSKTRQNNNWCYATPPQARRAGGRRQASLLGTISGASAAPRVWGMRGGGVFGLDVLCAIFPWVPIVE